MEGESQLSDKLFYKEVDSDLTELNKTEINTYLGNLLEKGFFNKSLHNKLLVNEPKTAELLPKIHKGKLPPPGRPIV